MCKSIKTSVLGLLPFKGASVTEPGRYDSAGIAQSAVLMTETIDRSGRLAGKVTVVTGAPPASVTAQPMTSAGGLAEVEFAMSHYLGIASSAPPQPR